MTNHSPRLHQMQTRSRTRLRLGRPEHPRAAPGQRAHLQGPTEARVRAPLGRGDSAQLHAEYARLGWHSGGRAVGSFVHEDLRGLQV
jgi:hypothetical protein